MLHKQQLEKMFMASYTCLWESVCHFPLLVDATVKGEVVGGWGLARDKFEEKITIILMFWKKLNIVLCIQLMQLPTVDKVVWPLLKLHTIGECISSATL